ncbi:MAG: helicase-related protein [Kiritimatiellaeota bacterium]|nr:helicase-related protein [Kiritimatiellota bacterium]
MASKTGTELFLVDNSDADWKVLRYLHDWCQLAKGIDIATGYFEIGSLLALKDEWQKVDHIRLLMGDEVSKRTKAMFEKGLQDIRDRLDTSIESEKQRNDFLAGVPAIVDAIRSGRIQCRVYRKEKFHAKAYITHARVDVVGSSALVGSSNFTIPGLTENIELNVQITGQPVSVIQEWYEKHWQEAEDVTPDILKVFERHIREHTPFEVYARALQEFFRGHEMTVTEWEQTQSKMYHVLDHYQKEGYHSLMKIAAQHGGAFLCDGVGLGKTFVGLMLIERLVVHDRKRVILLVPKSARDDVWERDIRRYLRYLSGDCSNLVIFNHTDLLRGGDFPYRLDRLKEIADVVVIDEAHHFRNPGVKGEPGDILTHYWRLYDLLQGPQGVKQLFMLTATPVNNRLRDFQHMIELFSRQQAEYFKDAPLGIHSLSGHFRKLEKALENMLQQPAEDADMPTNQVEAERVLWSDDLFRALVVQRSRGYVKRSQEQHGGNKAIFPNREPPHVAAYQLKKTYGRLLEMVEEAFDRKQLFSLAVYYPMAPQYYIGPKLEKQKQAFIENRQRQLVRLIRTQFLKRFESSARAFEFSCGTLLVNLLAWVTKHSETAAEKRRLERWKGQHEQLLDYVHHDRHELLGEELDQDAEEDLIDDELLTEIEPLRRDHYKVEEILAETFLDLDQLAEFLKELKKFKPAHDDKLNTLIKLLKTNPALKEQKVLIFSEYMATARYLEKQLAAAGFADVAEVDSTKNDRSKIIRRFAPYYNRPAQGELFEGLDGETRILISTDVLSEGLNLQDATRLINYDLHWNPVRLMQRIGRVDRRLNLEIEAQIIADHPDQREIRGTVGYWNFLPPEELEVLLKLYAKVSKKTLRISKVFGIEGKRLLKPTDDYEAMKDFNHAYEGEATAPEAMHLEFQQLLKDHPDLDKQLNALPLHVFSGKQHPTTDARAVFFCYALPAPTAKSRETGAEDAQAWTEEAGHTKWYLFALDTEKIADEPSEIIGLIRSKPDTPRRHVIEEKTLSEIRAAVERHIKNSYLKQVQAPVGVKPVLKCWMELS